MHDLHQALDHQCLMVIKLDMEQAYDQVRWSFLKHALHNFDFHTRWITWIMTCVHHPSFSILLNNTPLDFFFSSMGIHQGYPLSPYIFIYCADILYRALFVATSSSALVPYRPASNALSIFHLLFVDNCLLVDRASI